MAAGEEAGQGGGAGRVVTGLAAAGLEGTRTVMVTRPSILTGQYVNGLLLAHGGVDVEANGRSVAP